MGSDKCNNGTASGLFNAKKMGGGYCTNTSICTNEKANYVEGLVSVIIPTYNNDKYIFDSVLSALNQTYKKIEIIVIDDASKDETKKKLEPFLKYKNFIYFQQDKNQGVAAARNKGMDIASGQYIAFLDSDDIWRCDKIEKQIELLRENKMYFSYTALEMIDEEGSVIKESKKIKDIVDYDYLLKNTIISTSSVLIDISKIGKFYMPRLQSCEDYISWLTILKKGFNAIGVNEPLLQYRKTSTSLSAKKSKNIINVWKAQVISMNVNPIKASINCFCYAINGVIKHCL